MTASMWYQALRDAGWDVRLVSPAGELVAAQSPNVLSCSDCGPSATARGLAPARLPGGVHGVVAALGSRDLTGLRSVVERAEALGCRAGAPEVAEGESSVSPCCYFDLWSRGQLNGLAEPSYTAREGAIVLDRLGGVALAASPARARQSTIVNFVAGTTVIEAEHSLVIDAWLLESFGIDPESYLYHAVEVLSKMGLDARASILAAE